MKYNGRDTVNTRILRGSRGNIKAGLRGLSYSRSLRSPIIAPGTALGLLLLQLVALVVVVLHGSLLVLLVLGNQVVHVGLRLGELHLVHALAGVPVEERLPPEHRRELLGDALEELL